MYTAMLFKNKDDFKKYVKEHPEDKLAKSYLEDQELHEMMDVLLKKLSGE